MNHEPRLDALHARVVRQPWLQLFAAMTRGLLAVGFILPSLPKLMGKPFTQLPTTHPVGYFFDAFFQAGGYYSFVGVAQLLAGALLLFRRTATLGAVLYFPIVLNIFVINVAIDFEGTKVVTGFMLLACAFLLCWDYDRWKALVPGFGAPGQTPGERHLGLELVVLAAGAAGLVGLGLAMGAIATLERRSLGMPLLLLTAGALVAPLALLRFRRVRASAVAPSRR
ncbi:MAG TPA: hypothetical protein VFO83_03955 [Aggregicoccus sp.]|nr:hypothetical protein [Aggregicoccus sp.]